MLKIRDFLHSLPAVEATLGWSLESLDRLNLIVRAIRELQGESASNGNGNYLRTTIGGAKIQICWRRDIATSNPTVWTFPAAFSATPVVLGIMRAGTVARIVTVVNESAVSADFYGWTDAGSPSTVTHNALAIGFWE